MIARRLIVHGRVQGVGFRYAMVDAATSAGASGWVRNRNDGTVEALVQAAYRHDRLGDACGTQAVFLHIRFFSRTI